MPKQPQPMINVRSMRRSDLPRIAEIERQSFPHAWPAEHFIRVFQRRSCDHLVAEDEIGVVGFVIYDDVDPRKSIAKYLRDLPPSQPRFHLLNLAVDPEHRRRGIGKAMLDKLKATLGPQRRRILLEVRETNFAAQLFFRSQGFRAISVLRDFYDDVSEDAYLMQFRQAEPLSVDRIGGLEKGSACRGV